MKFEEFKMDPAWEEETKAQYSRYFTEIWENHEYDRHGLIISQGDIVVDCGASIGIFSRYALKCGASKIISFEADQNVFEYLSWNCSRGKIKPINGRICTEMGENSYDLSRIFDDFKLEKVDFIKVDVEGCEYELILEAPEDLLKKVRQWSIELHAWGMFRNHADEFIKIMAIMEKFTRCGFKLNVEKIHKNTCLYMLYASL
jgi:tRNA G37 N-methylase Trm5